MSSAFLIYLNVGFAIVMVALAYLATRLTCGPIGGHRGLEPYLLGTEIVLVAIAFLSDWAIHIASDVDKDPYSRAEIITNRFGMLITMLLVQILMLIGAIIHEQWILVKCGVLQIPGRFGSNPDLSNTGPTRPVSITQFLTNNMIGWIALGAAATAKIYAELQHG